MGLKPKEELKIYQRVFDNYTMKTLISLVRKRYFDSLDFPISTGKEADVYRCTTKDGFIAVKIYRIEMSNFRAMQRYLLGDPRFERIKGGKRSTVSVWCQKEFRNLRDAHKAGVRVPKPIKAVNNILLMEFIGDKYGSPCPLLKNVKPENPQKLINTLTRYVRLMWKKAKIVHGDLNEYNTVIKGKTTYLIDIGQAMSVKHPIALELLERDLMNIKRLARKYRVDFDYAKIMNSLVK